MIHVSRGFGPIAAVVLVLVASGCGDSSSSPQGVGSIAGTWSHADAEYSSSDSVIEIRNAGDMYILAEGSESSGFSIELYNTKIADVTAGPGDSFPSSSRNHRLAPTAKASRRPIRQPARNCSARCTLS